MLMQAGNIYKLFDNNKVNHKCLLTPWFYSPLRTLVSFMTYVCPLSQLFAFSIYLFAFCLLTVLSTFQAFHFVF
jgi:hypothetical protein